MMASPATGALVASTRNANFSRDTRFLSVKGRSDEPTIIVFA